MTADKPTVMVPKMRFPEFRSAGDWRFPPLREIVEPLSERVGALKCVPMSVTAGVGLVSQEEKFGRTIAGDSYKNYIRLQSNDFAYNKSATKEYPQGYIARYSGTRDAAVPNSIFSCFRPYAAVIIPEYLEHLFHGNHHGRWLRRYITVGARAHGALSVSDDALMSMPVPLPPVAVSHPEQQKIADCLGSLDNLIAAEGRKLEALRKHKQGLMQQLFPQPGETVPRLRFPEFHSAGPWEEKRIGDLEPFVTSGSRGWAAFYAPQGSLFVRITNLSRESIYLDFTDSKYVELPPSTNESSRTTLRPDDVLISITADIGIIGYVDADTPLPAYINQHIALVRFDVPDVRGKFVAYFLASEGAQRQFRSATDNGAKAGMNLMAVQAMSLLLPPPREQQRVADCLSSLDTCIARQIEFLDALKRYKQGLLQQLFPSLEEE